MMKKHVSPHAFTHFISNIQYIVNFHVSGNCNRHCQRAIRVEQKICLSDLLFIISSFF